MARYIDADKLIEKYERAIDEEWNKTTAPPSWSMAWECIIEDIEEEPTADVAEVKHGEWVQEWELEKGLEDNSEFPYIKCSLCGHIEWGIEKELYETPNYCSECGAKMDGGKEE